MKNQNTKNIKRAIGVFYGLKYAQNFSNGYEKPTMIIIGYKIFESQQYWVVSETVGKRMLKEGFKSVK
jgi:hypothetical protein